MPLNVYNLCVSKSRWVTAGIGKKMIENTFWIWQCNKEQIVRWKNRERMNGWLQTMLHLWRAFGWCSNPVNVGIGPARSTSQIYTIHWLLWWKSTNVTPSKSSQPPSLAAKTTWALSGNQSCFLADTEVLGEEKKFQLCNFAYNQATLSVAEACKSINIEGRKKKKDTHRRAENPHTQSPIKFHLQLLSNWAWVAC